MLLARSGRIRNAHPDRERGRVGLSVNADIDKPILEQNADQQRYIASLTKMMTALLFLESGKDMNAEITIPPA